MTSYERDMGESSRERVLSESADVMPNLLRMDPKHAVGTIVAIDNDSNDLLYAYAAAVEKEYNKAAKAYRIDPELADHWLQKRKAVFDAIESL